MNLKKDQPYVLFLQETKCTSEIIYQMMAWIYKYCLTIVIDAQGVSGGLSIHWNPLLITLDEATSSRHSLSSSFHIHGSSIKGFIMNVYGPQTVNSKMNLLNHLDWFYNLHLDSPVLRGGDFNMITNLGVKKVESNLFRWKMMPSKTL